MSDPSAFLSPFFSPLLLNHYLLEIFPSQYLILPSFSPLNPDPETQINWIQPDPDPTPCGKNNQSVDSLTQCVIGQIFEKPLNIELLREHAGVPLINISHEQAPGVVFNLLLQDEIKTKLDMEDRTLVIYQQPTISGRQLGSTPAVVRQRRAADNYDDVSVVKNYIKANEKRFHLLQVN